jgi:hypothetical protein
MLAAALRAPCHERDAKSGAFVDGFVRPPGLKRPPTDVFVDAIDALLESPAAQAQSTGPRRKLARAAAAPLLLLCLPEFCRSLVSYAKGKNKIRSKKASP